MGWLGTKYVIHRSHKGNLNWPIKAFRTREEAEEALPEMIRLVKEEFNHLPDITCEIYTYIQGQ